MRRVLGVLGGTMVLGSLAAALWAQGGQPGAPPQVGDLMQNAALKAAIAAAKYVEQPVPRVLPLGKKARAEIEARDAAKGTQWEDLLEWPASVSKAGRAEADG